ncbi:MAG: serine/threonine-protein kinase, partial [Planctomycetota bacterium]|nr:serine/threonine-protein kinase [Planctomycetota bacterium]
MPVPGCGRISRSPNDVEPGNYDSMSDYEQVKKIFNKAVKFPQGRVGGYLDRVCGDDAALRAEVEKLLLNHLRNATTRQGDGDSTRIAGDYRVGDTIDKFKIRKTLGEGGMGIVYLAEQAKPIKRQVAVKVLKPGTDTKATLNRFDAERQALAIMDHPGIAKVLDAGATKEGRPWFAMEYIEGQDLTSYCDAHQIALRDRLVLFANICDAIQHAHVKGIVHRDLKPGNILIARDENGMPQAKIIDFGIAKAMSATLTDVTHHTSIGTLVGTIKYMSPEQVGGEFDIDTRTDIYALGVILYEMICGQSPFEWKTLQSLGENEIRRVIRDKIPPNPTTLLSNLDAGDLKSIAQKREVLPAQLVRTLRRELEWIPLKALRKARDDRYPSAEAFAADVRNYLNGHPLVAAPVTRFYRARKFLMRNKFGTGVAASFLLLLIVALLVVLVALGEARDNLQLANEKTTEAEKGEIRVGALKEFVLNSLHPDELVRQLQSRKNFAEGNSRPLDPHLESQIYKALADLRSREGNYREAIKHR